MSPSFPPRLPPSHSACRCRAVIYFNIQVVRGQRRIIRLLKEQIANVRELHTLPLAHPSCSMPWSSWIQALVSTVLPPGTCKSPSRGCSLCCLCCYRRGKIKYFSFRSFTPFTSRGRDAPESQVSPARRGEGAAGVLGAQPGAWMFLGSVLERGWQEHQSQPSPGRAPLVREREGAGGDGVSQPFPCSAGTGGSVAGDEGPGRRLGCPSIQPVPQDAGSLVVLRPRDGRPCQQSQHRDRVGDGDRTGTG